MSRSQCSKADVGYQPRIPTVGYNIEVGDPDARWYAVWTRSRQEKVAAAALTLLGIYHYLPLNSELRRWSDRMQMVEVPLFTGYLFVCINLLNNSKLQVLKVLGIAGFVGTQAGPITIPGQQIEDIRTVLSAGVECSVQPFLKQGDRVRVVRGALAGVEGTLVHANSTSRLLISIEMIRQSLSLNILRQDVELVRINSVPAKCFGYPPRPSELRLEQPGR